MLLSGWHIIFSMQLDLPGAVIIQGVKIADRF
jgi:hypothetical protein